MLEFLSAAWIDALDHAARAVELPDAATSVSFTVEQVVHDAPGGEARYHMRIADGHARVHRGPADAPDLRLLGDYDIAVRIQRGVVSAQEALAAGRLKLQGRLESVVGADEALRALEDVFAPLRAETTYRKPGPSR